MARRKSTGRPSAFGRQATRTKFLKALRSGSTIKMACAYAGISDTAYYRFMTLDAPPADMSDDVFNQFRDDIMRATDKGATELLTAIAADPDWRAKAWILERRRPAEFSKIDRHEVSGRDGGPIGIANVSDLPDDVLNLLAEAAERSQESVDDGDDVEG